VSLSVSVVLVVRNGAAGILDALASVNRNDAKPLEILVVDGGSTDETVALASSVAGVRVVRQVGPGIASAYNEGILMARGDVIAFISHDDIWLPGKLDAQLAHLAEHGDADGCVTMVQHVLTSAEVPPGFRAELLERPVAGFIMEALCVRRATFERVGLFDPAIPISNDTDWFARARDGGTRLDVLPEVLVEKRIHGSNTSLSNVQLHRELLAAMRASIARKRGSAA
jgi:glycosyltransferase involved in cell wall biosynthesis